MPHGRKEIKVGRLCGVITVRQHDHNVFLHVTLGVDNARPKPVVNLWVPDNRALALAKFLKELATFVEKEVLL